jgi:hypothetical protein
MKKTLLFTIVLTASFAHAEHCGVLQTIGGNTEGGDQTNIATNSTCVPATTETISGCEIYAVSCSGVTMQCGIYDNTGPSGKPGALVCGSTVGTSCTASSWNFIDLSTVCSGKMLTGGSTYYIGRQQSSGMTFAAEASGNLYYYSYSYGSWPSTFSTSPNQVTTTESAYLVLGSTTPSRLRGSVTQK